MLRFAWKWQNVYIDKKPYIFKFIFFPKSRFWVETFFCHPKPLLTYCVYVFWFVCFVWHSAKFPKFVVFLKTWLIYKSPFEPFISFVCLLRYQCIISEVVFAQIKCLFGVHRMGMLILSDTFHTLSRNTKLANFGNIFREKNSLNFYKLPAFFI